MKLVLLTPLLIILITNCSVDDKRKPRIAGAGLDSNTESTGNPPPNTGSGAPEEPESDDATTDDPKNDEDTSNPPDDPKNDDDTPDAPDDSKDDEDTPKTPDDSEEDKKKDDPGQNDDEKEESKDDDEDEKEEEKDEEKDEVCPWFDPQNPKKGPIEGIHFSPNIRLYDYKDQGSFSGNKFTIDLRVNYIKYTITVDDVTSPECKAKASKC